MHTNALSEEKSPYLKQHAHNPVDWLAWGERAFEKARREDKPIFLSIGYSTCHWCHVMAHESFENEQIAEVLNRFFVPVKVDREERPDVDRIYMLFVQATTGSGGWPMSVWLTPDLKPFFGGTYYAPDARYGRPGFRDILLYLARSWSEERDKVTASGDGVAEQLREMNANAKAGLQPDRELFSAAYNQFRRAFDSTWGGFGGAPKFPRPVVFNYLLRYYAAEKNDEALDMVTQTLRAMAAGGMHDQLGGGFHRYSVDERWFVPHFEKMLYDQAQLAVSFLEAFQITRDPHFAQVARDIFTYVLRDMTEPGGAFYSAEDADSPDPDNPSHSGEGSFYIWKKTEIEALLGLGEAATFCKYFGVSDDGNVEHDPHGEFTGRNILYVAQSRDPEPPTVSQSKQILFNARDARPRPHLDNKILTSWNGMMISAFAKASVVLGDAQYLAAAERALTFLLANMYDEASGRLMRRFCDGEAAVTGFLDDYAFLAQALLDLFEATSDPQYLERAVDLVNRGMLQFEDAGAGGFYSTAEGESDLLLRMKDDYDGAEPSGNSVATDVMLRLAHLTGNTEMDEKAGRALRSFAPKLKAQPTMAPQMTVALGRWLGQPEQIVIRCPEKTDEVMQMLTTRRQTFAPNSSVLAVSDEGSRRLSAVAPFLGSLERKGRLTIYECRNLTCELPKVIE